jgi:Tfp pilus tip-associated adhesin PilY1
LSASAGNGTTCKEIASAVSYRLTQASGLREVADYKGGGRRTR